MFKTSSVLVQALEESFLAELRKFTSAELKEYNGKSDNPVYLAYKGKVYDVSESDLWRDGEHMGLHQAGKDITEELDLAPHMEEVFERVKIVGELV
jgi:predicted heme/steroid binding protein